MKKSGKKYFFPTLALTVVALVVSTALVFTYNATKKEQVGNLSDEATAACETLFADSETFDTLDLTELRLDERIQNVILPSGSDAIGFEIELKGYSKGLVLVIGLNADGSVLGYEVAESSETPGLGTQIAESDFKNQFTGKNVSSFTAVKGKTSADSDIAVISGATISSKAVVEGMNLALAAYPNVKEAASR